MCGVRPLRGEDLSCYLNNIRSVGLWSLSCEQSVFQRYYSEKHLSEYCPQDGGESQLASKLRHCHPVYSLQEWLRGLKSQEQQIVRLRLGVVSETATFCCDTARSCKTNNNNTWSEEISWHKTASQPRAHRSSYSSGGANVHPAAPVWYVVPTVRVSLQSQTTLDRFRRFCGAQGRYWHRRTDMRITVQYID